MDTTLRQISKSRRTALERVKLGIDSALILIAGVSLWATCISNRRAAEAIRSARQANQISQESLSVTHTPWLQIRDLSVNPENDHDLKFAFAIKNFAQSPALDVKVDVAVGDRVLTSSIERGPAIMPQDTQLAWTVFGVRSENREFLRSIRYGRTRLPIVFRLSYKDILRNTHTTEVRYRWERDGFVKESYSVLS